MKTMEGTEEIRKNIYDSLCDEDVSITDLESMFTQLENHGEDPFSFM